MNEELERNLGEQPIARIMRAHNLKPHDLVTSSSAEMTHKPEASMPARNGVARPAQVLRQIPFHLGRSVKRHRV